MLNCVIECKYILSYIYSNFTFPGCYVKCMEKNDKNHINLKAPLAVIQIVFVIQIIMA